MPDKLTDDELLRLSEEPDDASKAYRGREDREEARAELRRRGVDEETIELASVGKFGPERDPGDQMVDVEIDGNKLNVPRYLADFMLTGKRD